MACGKADAELFVEAVVRARAKLESVLSEHEFVRKAERALLAQSIHFELLGALAAFLGDPDARVCIVY